MTPDVGTWDRIPRTRREESPVKATFNDIIIAESDQTVVVEGNHYFPAEDVHRQFLDANGETYECPWKGHADYYDVTVDGVVAHGAAWVYPEPKPAAAEIAGHFAFWREVKVSE
jgi:uncharacterized protein (DUF427 family)